MNAFSWLWIGWFVYFGVVEAVAVVQSVKAKRAGKADPRDTLSEHAWFWAGINTKGVGVDRNVGVSAWSRRILFAAFMLWLGTHMLGGGAIV